ncbi:MAG TPA: hypothetical protein VFS00_25885, partial [Polyangiaceae bacterium]|nr:hypothetical protein [Polyangiaceae bacterium]
MKTPSAPPARRPSPVGSPARALALWFGVGALVAAACGRSPIVPAAKVARKAAASALGAAPPADEKLAPFDASDEELCALPLARVSAAPPSAAPFSSPETHCVEKGDPFCDTVDRSPDPNDACFVANDNLRRAERAVKA